MNTMQQEFDAVVAHLYKQGRPAKTGETGSDLGFAGCRYRAGTLSCAVGCRIPDAAYTEDMDIGTGHGGTNVSILLRRFADVLPPEIKAYKDMFRSLQGVHDIARTNPDGTFKLAYLAEGLQYVADAFSLTFIEPTTQEA
jgi:hypothetical protein